MERSRQLDAKDEMMISALAEGTTHEEAARLAGVSTKTVQRRRREQRFARALDDRRRQRVGEVTGRLVAGSHAAVQTLLDGLEADGMRERLTAARAILDLGRRYHREQVEEDLAARLEALEEALCRAQQDDSGNENRDKKLNDRT
jgi:hypothetical protein